MARAAAALAPVDKTMLPSRGGRLECWAATTKDGKWGFTREEDEATSWTVTHLPTKTVVDCFVPTLTACRAYVASGGAQADLELIQAHQQGGHAGQRDKACPKC